MSLPFNNQAKVDRTDVFSPASECWMMAILPQIIIQMTNYQVHIIDNGSNKIQLDDLSRYIQEQPCVTETLTYTSC